jgi:anaerobic ribonucleoside-triphosphate reductase
MFVIKNETNNTICGITTDAVQSSQWQDIEDSIMGRRNPVVVHHMSRIVGYFSKIENWHDTKLSELEDRHKGDYIVK